MNREERNARAIARAIRSIGGYGKAKVIAVCVSIVAVCVAAVILVFVINSSKAREGRKKQLTLNLRSRI